MAQRDHGAKHPKKRKRAAVRVACNACRQRKTACDGKRDECSPCARRGTPCDYITESINETPNMALKRQVVDLQSQKGELEQIIGYLRSATDFDAMEALRRIRSSPSNADTLAWIREAEGLDTDTSEMGTRGLDAVQEEVFDPSLAHLDDTMSSDLKSATTTTSESDSTRSYQGSSDVGLQTQLPPSSQTSPMGSVDNALLRSIPTTMAHRWQQHHPAATGAFVDPYYLYE